MDIKETLAYELANLNIQDQGLEMVIRELMFFHTPAMIRSKLEKYMPEQIGLTADEWSQENFQEYFERDGEGAIDFIKVLSQRFQLTVPDAWKRYTALRELYYEQELKKIDEL